MCTFLKSPHSSLTCCSFDGFGNDDEVGATSEHLQPYNKDSAVAKAITDKVNEAVTHLANDYVSNIERKLYGGFIALVPCEFPVLG